MAPQCRRRNLRGRQGTALLLGLFLATFALLPSAFRDLASAQGESRPITLVVGFPAGSGTLDAFARIVRTLEGLHARAEPLFQRALVIDGLALGPDDPRVATHLNNLAALYVDMGDDARAEPLHLRALAMREKLYPPTRFPDSHPNLATSLNNLALLYNDMGDYAKAEPLYQQALQIRQRILSACW